MACLKDEIMEKLISDNDLTLLVCNLGRCCVGEQAQASQQRLGQEVFERLRCSVSRSVYRLYIKSANQISISANQIY